MKKLLKILKSIVTMMKTIHKLKGFLVIISILTIIPACNKEDPDQRVNPHATEINEFFQQLPDWNTDSVSQADPVFKEDIMVPTGNATYKCEVFEKNLVKTLADKIISVGTNAGVIWPGNLIQGNTLKEGELKAIDTERSPITIQINIPLDESSRVVDLPTSINVQQAISDFQIAAGQMPEGSQAGAGFMNFSVQEAASFEQSMLAMGISGGFTDPQSQVGLDASASVSVERSYREHTVIAKLFQEMFTVRMADDLFTNPSDFFAEDVTPDDITELENKGMLGENNIPLYIESVTYGRILLFTMTSTNVASGSELSAALQASFSDYANAEASLTDEQKQILDNSTATVFSAGGTKEAANAAIANLNWAEFFKAAPATTAVPVSFTTKSLKGKKIAKLVGNVSYLERENCQAPASYDVTVTWTNNEYTGVCNAVTCPQQVFVKLATSTIGTQLTILNDYTFNMSFSSDDINTPAGRQFTIRSLVELPLFGAVATKTKTSTYDVTSLTGGNNPDSHTLSNAAGSVTLDFRIRKVVNYD